MPDLDFQIEGVAPVPYAVAPLLAFKLHVSQVPHASEPLVPIHSVILRCQVRLEPARRRYAPSEQQGLNELFGEPHRWGQTVHSMLWANTSVSVPAFTEQILIDLPLSCTFDFNVAATKYFNALQDGQVPLSLLFSGTIFYASTDESLQVAQISWEKEASFQLPVSVWKQMMDHYYPNTAWFCLRRDVFDRLNELKSRRAFSTLDQVVEMLLEQAEPSAIESVSP